MVIRKIYFSSGKRSAIVSLPGGFMPSSMGMILLALFLVSTYFSLLWLLYYQKGNISLVDIGWSSSFILIGLLYFWLGEGKFSRKILLLVMILLWAGRLTIHLLRRFSFEKEDPRYTELASGWKGKIEQKVYALYLGQGALAVLLSLPFLLIFQNRIPHLSLLENIGIAVWLIGFLGEAWSDSQLASFREQRTQPDAICEEGFWYYSRHPNYFFEWLIWLGFALFALAAPYGWLGLLSPLVILGLLLFVTGVPCAERQALRSKGDAYRRYQETTSAFIPWFKKRGL